jgi:hypothetical protein
LEWIFGAGDPLAERSGRTEDEHEVVHAEFGLSRPSRMRTGIGVLAAGDLSGWLRSVITEALRHGSAWSHAEARRRRLRRRRRRE